ncbi:hypothetical protein CLV49_1816 [Labedella gwakjiensis]|uniref:Uncharacterized protein n=1 Tax=Labedella gwakjiensis TaxID=390269 RepID=A0A2P8GW45_9MICO|nr:hypothetical protein CLV49_1816 [Labedella gwakjiensis]
MMRNKMTAVWGSTAVLCLAGIIAIQGAFGDAVTAADQSSGTPAIGVLLIAASLVLAALLVVSVAGFARVVTKARKA